LKKFDMLEAITRRSRELRGESVPPDDIDKITAYTRRRMKEIQEDGHSGSSLDNSALGCYTVSTMGDRDGET
jgi:hypothetical protein